jgi:transposase
MNYFDYNQQEKSFIMLKIQLTPSELDELKTKLKAAKRGKTLEYLDLKIIDFSNSGKTVKEISRLLGLHPNTVRKIIHQFTAEGFKGLIRKSRGKPSIKLKVYDKDYWEDILSQPPRLFEKLDTNVQNWNYSLIQTYIHVYLGLQVSIGTIWQHLRRVGFTSGRAKLSVTSPDPEYQVKRKRIDTLQKKF